MNELFYELIIIMIQRWHTAFLLILLRGVVVKFRQKFGRPSEYVKKLTCQTVPNGSSVFGLFKKSQYFDKPTDTNYDIAFRHLEQELIKQDLRTLICLPMS